MAESGALPACEFREHHGAIEFLAMPQVILSFTDARAPVEEIAAQLAKPETESADLLPAPGRVLAEPVIADRHFPPFPRATRDGYAVRSADVARSPAALKIVGEIRAGGPEQQIEIRDGECAEIMTGAPVPATADAVVMVEYTSRAGETVEIKRTVSAGENIVPAGAEAKRGDMLLCPGTRLTPAAIAV